MRIYLGGKWTEKKYIRSCMDLIEQNGHSLTFDWTTYKDDESDEQMALSAVLDIKGVQECDVMIADMTDPKYPYRGTFTEVGCALGLNKQVIIVCSYKDAYCRTNCFFHHPNVTCVSGWNECMAKLAK